MIWGQGDASGLRVVDTPFGRLGGLICWENYMPLARYSLYAEGVQIYVASTWDEGDGWLATMRHIASEGRCWVIGSGCALNSDDVPTALPARDTLFPNRDTWLNSGDSVIIIPMATWPPVPCTASTGSSTPTFTRQCPRAPIGPWMSPDTTGRPDVFNLTVDRTPRPPITFIAQD